MFYVLCKGLIRAVIVFWVRFEVIHVYIVQGMYFGYVLRLSMYIVQGMYFGYVLRLSMYNRCILGTIYGYHVQPLYFGYVLMLPCTTDIFWVRFDVILYNCCILGKLWGNHVQPLYFGYVLSLSCTTMYFGYDLRLSCTTDVFRVRFEVIMYNRYILGKLWGYNVQPFVVIMYSTADEVVGCDYSVYIILSG